MKKLSIKLYIVFYCTMIGLATGCITPYEPDVEWINDLLVVEGTIIAPYGTTIHINRTNEGSSSFYDPSLTGKKAIVTLISDKGTTIATAKNTTGGTYTLTDSISFKPGEKYAIHFLLDGKEYQSDFVEPQITPEIDEVNFQYKEQEEVNIRVSTHNDDPNGSPYYRWTYKEDWEIRSEYFASYVWDGEIVERISHDSPKNTFYCWKNNSSINFLLGKTEQMKINKIKDHTLINIPRYDDRLSYLYSVLVRQYSLDKEAFEYFRNLQKNIDEAGGLFAPQPTEIKGNITCLTNPKETVIGYINASTETTYRLFFNAYKLAGMGDVYNCKETESVLLKDIGNAYGKGLAILDLIDDRGGEPIYKCINRRCVDCLSRGGTKDKPDFWPNDHK
ncbi:DUF4249 domain-containing protein [uncultured Parabacteroides sp.]|uniref:DUF4249 domain-containing protein n=1 Tax=uncultured Parabacteroides sp. TaxID=512312 RepID=UPI0026DB7B77|nr:DUF4249 domain-containing protein [uncultured Parabacteroides sp.]